MKTKIFLNLAVKDLKRSVDFFTQLGFSFNQKFTNDKGICLEIGENINAMLLTEEFYQTFTKKQICDTKTTSEVLIAVSVESRERVDEIMEKAIKAGGTDYEQGHDFEWMYLRTFLDLDGHHWEFYYMDENNMPNSPE